MKQTLIVTICLLTFSPSFGQSKTFTALQKKFAGEDEVVSFHASGFLARTVLMFAGEPEFRKAIRKVSDIRLIAIPNTALHDRGFTVGSLRNTMMDDSFDELIRIRENGDDMSVYLQPGGPASRYLILIHNPDEVVAVEIKGFIDLNALDSRIQLAFESE